MTRDRDRLLPVLHAGFDPFDYDRRAEHRAVKHRADRPVRAFPHFLQIVFLHARRVRRDRRTFDCHAVFLRGVRGIHRHLVVRLVAVFQSEIIVLGVELDKRTQQLILNHFPEDPGHLIPVHLHQRGRHFNLIHISSPFLYRS